MTATALEIATPETASPTLLPAPGAAVAVRNRRAVVVEVDPFEHMAEPGRRLVRVVYGDGQSPVSESILWGLEGEFMMSPQGFHLAPRPVHPRLLRALLQTRKWATGVPFPGMEEPPRSMADTPVAPLYAGIRPLPHQLVPLEAALSQPNVRLLLADDVGLGKTIEAGLIMTELLVRRRIHRILVLAPPGLREQWQQELWQRFALDFRIVDGAEDRRLRKELGEQSNPWSLYPRIIASPHYLKSTGPLDAFVAGCSAPIHPHAPWDLLVVDEAHHLAPTTHGPETLLTRMLRTVAPWFEHRVFLTATPHDGYSSSYTGLLEILDPVRFRKTAAPTAAERRRQRAVVIRRTRRSLSGRKVTPARTEVIPVNFQPAELNVLERFRKLRERLPRWGIDTGGERQSGALLSMEVLSRRLLSSWAAFDASYQAFRVGLHEGVEVRTLPNVGMATAGADLAEPVWSRLARRLGGWMARYYPHHLAAFEELGEALSQLAPQSASGVDSRRDAWVHWLRREVCQGTEGARAVVFTEYVATLESLVRAIDGHLPELVGRCDAVSGQTGAAKRREALSNFCSSTSDKAVLMCTDVLAEGLNLHHQASRVFHYDLPWNPAVLQQRLGRLDRLGQSHPVTSYHFRSLAIEELRLQRRLEDKVARIAVDIGQPVPFLAPLPRPDEPAVPTLFRIAATPAEECGPAICARTVPLRATRAALVAQGALLGANPSSMREAVAELLRATWPAADLTIKGNGALEVTGGRSLGPALSALTAGPSGAPAPTLLLDFQGDLSVTASAAQLARIHPGHPLLRWLLARHEGRDGTPWISVRADRSAVPVPGLLIFALESAVALGNPALHQALLPLWLPLLSPPELLRVGPLESARRGLVSGIMDGRLKTCVGLPGGSRERLAQLASQALQHLVNQRNNHLEEALAEHRSALLAEHGGAVQRRIRELASGVENGPAEALAGLERRQRSGVLLPELAAELAARVAELRREVGLTAARRERLLAAIEEEAKRGESAIASRHHLVAPLTIRCEGIVYVWPGGNHGV